MSWEPTASYVSAGSLDLNSVAVVHQAELEGFGDAGKSDGDSAAGDDLSVVDRKGDNNVSEVEGKEGSGEGVHLGAKLAGFSQESWKKGEEVPIPAATPVDPNNDLKFRTDSPKLDDADKSGAKHLPGDTNLVSKELFSDDNGSDVGFKEDGSSGEVDEAPKSEPAGETLEVELGKYVDNKQLQSKEEQVLESEFSVCDMVWGKVRSHPWWPGQIYDPSFASDMALKHQKKDHFLVAYFGDKTFAWNDESRLKPFEYFFAQMEKQSSLDEFVESVDEALGELARRIEIGMTCGCITDEFIAGLNHQIVENAGIKEGTCCPTLDRCAVASLFDPGRMLDYIYGLAQFPCGGFDKLELVKVNAQLKAIYMSKGYSELPEFCIGGGLSHNEEISAHGREEAGQDDVEFKKDEILSNDLSSKERRRGRGRPPGKKKVFEEDGRSMEYKKDEILSNDTSSKEKRRGRGRPPGKEKVIDEGGRSMEYTNDGLFSNDAFSKEKRRGRGRPPGKEKAIDEDGSSMEHTKDELFSNDASSTEKKRGRDRPPGKEEAIDEDERSMEYTKDESFSNDTSSKEKKRGRGRPPGKKKAIEEDGRKQRSLPELMKQTADLSALSSKNENYGVKASSKSSGKKHMISDPDSIGFGRGKKKRLNSLGDLGSLSDSSSGASVLKIGQHISRVANKMKISPSEHNGIKLSKSKSKTNGGMNYVHGNCKSTRRDAALMQDYPAPSEMLSQLCFVAKGPTKPHRFQSIVNCFFVNWRDSHVRDSVDDDELLNLVESKNHPKFFAESDLVPVEVKSDYLQDSYWSDVIFEENPKKEGSSVGRKRKANSKMNQTKKTKTAELSSLSTTLEPSLNTSEHVSDGSAILSDKQQQEERPVNLSDDKTVEECNPAALILSFSDPDGLPSESDLTYIFSQYGPLKEAETEVSRKSRRASVVFKRGSDAEVAFSSSGKFSAFGPKLVSYRLKYSTSSSPGTTLKMDPSPTKGGTSIVPDSGAVVPTDGKA